MKLRKCSAPPDLDPIDDISDSEWESSDGEWSDSEGKEALSDIPELEDEHEDTDSISDASDDGRGITEARMCDSDVVDSGSEEEHLPCQRPEHDKQADATADFTDQDSDDVEPEAHAETWNPFSLLTTSEDDDVAAEIDEHNDDIDPADDASDAEGAQQQDDAAAGPSSGRRRKNRRKKKRSTARQACSQAGAAGQAPVQPALQQQAAASHPQHVPLATPASTVDIAHAHAPQAADHHHQRFTLPPPAPTTPAAAPVDWRQYTPPVGSTASDPQARPDLETIRRIRELTAQLMARNASRVPAPALPQPQREPTVPAAGGAGLPGLWSPTVARAAQGVLPPAPRTTPPPPARQLVNPPSSSAEPLMAAAASARAITTAAAGMASAACGASSISRAAAAVASAAAEVFRRTASRPHHPIPQAPPAPMAATPTLPATAPASSALAGSSSSMSAAAPVPADCSNCTASAAAGDAAAEQAECWVCFSPGGEEEDALRLISPCRVCSGAMAHIHKGCFRKWLAASWATSCPNCARKYDSSVLDDYEEGRLVNSLLQQQVAAGRDGPDAPYPRGTVVYFTVGGMLQVHMRCGQLTPTELLRIIRNTVDDIRSSPPTLPSGERVQLAPDQLGLTHLVVEYPEEEEEGPAFGRPRSNAFNFPLYDDDDYDSEEDEEEEEYMYQDFFNRAARNVAGPGTWDELGLGRLPVPLNLAAGLPASRAGAFNALQERLVMEAQRTYDSQGYAGTWRVGGGGGHEAAAHGRQWSGGSAGAGSSRAAAARQQTRELQTMQQQQQRYNNRQQFARASTRQGGRRRC